MPTHEQSTMDEWRRLPDVLVQQVLSLIGLPDLCKLRTVYKRWNSIICSPEFGHLCAQNADEDARYIFGRCFHYDRNDSKACTLTITVVGWSIFDLKERRWYICKGEQHNTFANDQPLASDGGLVVSCSQVAGTTMVSEITISNPIGKTRKILPYPPFGEFWTDSILVNLVVDSISRTYKIFLINRHQDPYLCVFESTTNQWRSLSNIPVQLKGGETGRLASSVMFQGLFVISKTYRASTERRPIEEVPVQKFWLHSFNFLEDSWTDCGVNFPEWPDNGGNRIQLIASGNRLFVFLSNYVVHLEACHGSIKVEDSLSVTEILLTDRTLITVSHLAELPFDGQGLEEIRACGGYFEFLQAFGFGNSIMFMYRWLGFSIVVNVVTCLWELLPTDPTIVLGGKAMALRLPGADLW